MYYDGGFGAPTFQFGWGLSYTSFAYSWSDGAPPSSNIQISDVTSNDAALVSYRVNVTNIGLVTGDAIALLIVKGPSPDYPLERLINFARVTIAPGQTAQISFVTTAHDLSGVSHDGSRWLRNGEKLQLALGDRSSSLSHQVELSGKQDVPLAVWRYGPGKSKTLRKKA